MSDINSFITAVDEISDTLRFFCHKGWKGFDCPDDSIRILKEWGSRKDSLKNVETLPDIRNDLGDCQRCGLSSGRNNIVFGEGNPETKLVFVGEGPGYEEDQQGKPFVGAAGKLLTKIIHAMKLTRDDVYICNIVKCRPPKNRNPQQDEIVACLPFLERQIMAIRPVYICALGSFAARTLLNTERPISRLRGRFYDYGSVKVLPTYHPAYLLRNPQKKRDVWEDVQKLMKALEKED